MKKAFVILSLVFFAFSSVWGRQYDEDYLIQLVEQGDPQSASAFFQEHPGLAKKPRHMLEFIEVFRENLGEVYGHIPT